MVNPNMKATLQVLSMIITFMIAGGALLFNLPQQSSAQIGSMATLQNIGATYGVSIVPGAAQRNSSYHYYPPAIAIPVAEQSSHGSITILDSHTQLQVACPVLLTPAPYLILE